MSLILRLAVRVPVWPGVKVTLMVQLLPGARPLPQVFVCEKSPALDPVIVMLVMFRFTLVPRLVTVTLMGLLLRPTL